MEFNVEPGSIYFNTIGSVLNSGKKITDFIKKPMRCCT